MSPECWAADIALAVLAMAVIGTSAVTMALARDAATDSRGENSGLPQCGLEIR